MIEGKVYLSIKLNKFKRYLGFSYVDTNINKSVDYIQEINNISDLLLSYLESINLVLKTYIKLVADKKWVKYDSIKIILDKRFKRLTNKFTVDRLDNPSTPLETLIKLSINEYIELNNLVGNVKLVYKCDDFYKSLSNKVCNKLKETT